MVAVFAENCGSSKKIWNGQMTPELAYNGHRLRLFRLWAVNMTPRWVTTLLGSTTWKEGLRTSQSYSPVRLASVKESQLHYFLKYLESFLLPEELISYSSNAKWDSYHSFNTLGCKIINKLESTVTFPLLTSALLWFLLKEAAYCHHNALLLFMLHLQMAEGSLSAVLSVHIITMSYISWEISI